MSTLLEKTIYRNPYIPYPPSRRQVDFLIDLWHREGCYGGAAAGGKTVALLMGALMFSMLKNYHALLIRKNYADLNQPGSLMWLAKEWLQGKGPKWNQEFHRWTFPSGSTITFGHLDNEGDSKRYMSAQFQYIAVDEVTEHKTDKDYNMLGSRLRRPRGIDIPLRIRVATNPGGEGHAWVKARFIDNKTRVPTAYFTPAFLEDNPGIDRESYETSMRVLSYLNYQRMRLGNWDIEEAGNIFKREWFSAALIEPKDIPTEFDGLVRYWDFASAKAGVEPENRDYTVGCLMGVKNGVYYVLHIMRMRASPPEVEGIIRAVAERDGPRVMIFMEQEPGSESEHLVSYYGRNVLAGFSFRGNKSTGSKVVRADPVSAALYNGNLKVLNSTWTEGLVDEAVVFPSGAHDDQVDAMSGAFRALGIYGAAPGARRAIVR